MNPVPFSLAFGFCLLGAAFSLPMGEHVRSEISARGACLARGGCICDAESHAGSYGNPVICNFFWSGTEQSGECDSIIPPCLADACQFTGTLEVTNLWTAPITASCNWVPAADCVPTNIPVGKKKLYAINLIVNCPEWAPNPQILTVTVGANTAKFYLSCCNCNDPTDCGW